MHTFRYIRHNAIVCACTKIETPTVLLENALPSIQIIPPPPPPPICCCLSNSLDATTLQLSISFSLRLSFAPVSLSIFTFFATFFAHPLVFHHHPDDCHRSGR